jgi:hypothetical protein
MSPEARNAISTVISNVMKTNAMQPISIASRLDFLRVLSSTVKNMVVNERQLTKSEAQELETRINTYSRNLSSLFKR